MNLTADIANDAKVRGKLQALQRMVANLIDNALNYTEPSGLVTVSVPPGVGLGLSLVKAIVQSHHGQISVTSTLNVATTFTVTLPCVPVPS